MIIEINNLTAGHIDEKKIKRIAEKVLKGEKGRRKTVSIVFTGKIRIKELNRRYRKKDKATDVLSFLYDQGGEIVICPEKVKENAKKYGLSFKEELVRCLVHGMLHLSGYDHEKSERETKKMEKREFYYLSKV